MCLGLIHREGIARFVMELLPDHPAAPFAWLQRVFGDRSVQVAQEADVVVRRHRPQHLGRRLRALRVHVAEPERGLYPPRQAHAPVVPEHLPYPGVRAPLYAVVGAGHRPFRGEAGVEVGEEGNVQFLAHFDSGIASR